MSLEVIFPAIKVKIMRGKGPTSRLLHQTPPTVKYTGPNYTNLLVQCGIPTRLVL